MSKLDWSNLENLECPICSTALKQAKKTKMRYCPDNNCSFRIGREKYESIMGSRSNRRGYTKGGSVQHQDGTRKREENKVNNKKSGSVKKRSKLYPNHG